MVKRQLVGAPEMYRGYLLSVRLMGPDFLAYVDEREMSAFYTSPNAAIAGAQRFVNEEIAAKEKKG